MNTTWRILTGDVRESLASLADQSIQCCVTSPPYWGLRDYGTASWEGGDYACKHTPHRDYGTKSDTNGGQIRGGPYKEKCGDCGAIRIDSQIGLEPTPEAYVAQLVAVFREVRRVLKDDGVLWLNLGDSYAREGGRTAGVSRHWDGRLDDPGGLHDKKPLASDFGMKPKDLVGIPWRVAFALQADGWYLRSDIIWSKPNPMPESVTDRPTKAHEYIFLLTKSARYFYDAAAIAEELAYPNETRRPLGSKGAWQMDGREQRENGGGKPYDGYPDKRNCRSVWEITTQPYPDAHFATFPEAIPERCIKAGSKEGDTVLDPFTGSGTTGAVAARLGRHFIGCELNPAYVKLARKRIGSALPMFAQEIA